MRDWLLIMEKYGIYSPDNHTKTEQMYTFPNGSYIEFFSTDNHLKVRGPSRDIWFANECNLIDFDTYNQMAMRTSKNIFIDFNPADEYHWIYDNILTRKDCYFIQSSYKDNPFLPINQVKDIEMMQFIDKNTWNVFGLGNRGSSQHLIFPTFQTYNHEITDNYVFGLDFGYNHPSALVKCSKSESNLYLEEILCESHLTTNQLIERIKPIVGRKSVFCDSARPEVIEECCKAGISAVSANKNVKEGIDFIKTHRIFVHSSSINLQKEMRSYKWKVDKMDRIMDEPIKAFDDCCDAARYGTMSFKNQFAQYYPKTYKKNAASYGNF